MSQYYPQDGINTYINPISQDGVIIHAVNVVSNPYGGKSKRSGYSAFLGTPDVAEIKNLYAFPNIGNASGSINLIRASGSSLYYSLQGTGAWTLMGNGTISDGAHFGAAIGNAGTVMIGGDGGGSTRHSTNGTSWTNTTGAPISDSWAQYHNRAYAGGTASTLFYSTTNDVTNWNLSGTADSSSLTVPGEGSNQSLFKSADRLIITKTRGDMFNWDDYQLIDMATNYGPSSPYSIADVEDYRFWINQYGHFGFDGANAKLLSNAVQRYFYNRRDTGIVYTEFSKIPAVAHVYDYFASIGTVTDDFTGRTISNAVLNYNYQKNEYLMWQLAHFPRAYLSYNDYQGKRQLIFGDEDGQCYKMEPTLTSDAGAPIPSELVILFTLGTPDEKKWDWITLFFNPGCEINIQCAFSNTFTYEHLQWIDINDLSANPNQITDDGICEFRFPQDTRSRLMFLRLYENSDNSAWSYYGADINAVPQPIR